MHKSDFTVLFDLDGTLLNTLGDLADAINGTLRAFGYPEKTDKEVLASIGSGLRKAIKTVMPGDPGDAEVDAAFKLLREEYRKCYLNRTAPYPGVPEMLRELRGRGFRIAVLSNKADEYTSGLVNKHFQGLVDAASGETQGVPLKPAPDSAFAMLSRVGGTPGRAVYVGDSEVDAATARNAGIPCVLVSWGFRDRSALEREAAGGDPDISESVRSIPIADNTDEAMKMILAAETSTRTLYISDLDGTLLNENAQFSEYTKRVIYELSQIGVNFSIATARSPASALKVIEPIRVTAPVILMNGALVYDTSEGRYLKVEGIPAGAALSIVGAMRRTGVSGFMYVMEGDGLRVYYENLDAPPLRMFYENRKRLFGKVFTKIETTYEDIIGSGARVIYFTLRGSKDDMSPVRDEFAKIDGIGTVVCDDDYTPDLCFLECFGSGVSKRAAVRYLRELGGFGRVVGFGDNLNDLPLFYECDERYAPENAKDELKAAATAVIGSNRDDGVARFLSSRFNLPDTDINR